jgi:hypothetical protein
VSVYNTHHSLSPYDVRRNVRRSDLLNNIVHFLLCHVVLVDEDILVQRPVILDYAAHEITDDAPVGDRDRCLAISVEGGEDAHERHGLYVFGRERKSNLLPPGDVDPRVVESEFLNVIAYAVFLSHANQDMCSLVCQGQAHEVHEVHDSGLSGGGELRRHDSLHAGILCGGEQRTLRLDGLRSDHTDKDVHST